ncbi:MAG: hypothetical protein U1E15_05965 [Hyphomicrobiales bacterium]
MWDGCATGPADLRKHFDMANGDIDKLTTSVNQISKRGGKIEALELGPEAEHLPDAPRPRLVQG